MDKYKNRNEVPSKYKWDLSDFYKNDEELERDFKKGEELINLLPSYKGFSKDSKKTLELLKLIIDANIVVENLYVYTYLVNDQELGLSKSIKNKARAENLMSLFSVNTSYFEPELLSLSESEYEDLFKEDGLKEFRAMLDQIYREKEHVLSDAEEKIIASLTHAADHYDDMSSTMLNSEHDYGTVEINGTPTTITSTNYRSLMKNDSRELRKEIREKYSKTLEQYGASSAMFLSTYVALNETEARIHKFNSAWERKMFGLNMSEDVFRTLVSTVEEHVGSLQNYFKLYKSELGLDELHQYDTSLEMSKNTKEYTIEEAQDIILKALKPLGEDYLKHIKKVFDNHYIDYCEYKGKCSGGYSFSTIDHDSRILLSFNGNLDDVSTIAHEGGHNVHHQYVKDSNPPEYRELPSIVCEVASLTNECLLSSYLADNGETKEEKLAGIDNILGVIISNLFGAVREGKIEEDMYKEYSKNGAVTKEFMDKEVIDSFKKYYGDTLVLDDYSNVSWMRRSHYYMNYYLYSYSICISVASFVAKHILDGDKSMLDKYLNFLKTGGDKYPTEIFEILGIDLTKKEVYEDAIKYFDSMIDKYKEISNTRK